MTLSDFLKTLYPYLSDGKKQCDFVLFLVDCIMSDPLTEKDIQKEANGEYNPLTSLTISALNRIYDGSRQIEKSKAASIIQRVDKEKFTSLIDDLLDDPKESLCNTFNALGVTVTIDEFPKKCAEIFDEILTICASGTTKTKKSSNVLNTPNDSSSNPQLPEFPLATVYIKDGKIHIGGSSITLPEKLTPPQDIENHELIYISELLAAYAEAENRGDISKDDLSTLPKKYNRNYEEQRKNYYNAESLCRAVREIFGNSGINQFEILKTETYDGISDVYNDDYEHGYIRLTEVLKHSTVMNLSKSLLLNIPNWIGNSERKGVCHILVNDGTIKWVIRDE